MPRCSCSCRWWSGVTPWTKAAEASAEPPQRSAAPLYFHTGTEIRSVWDDYSKGRHDFNFYKFLDQTRDSTFGLRQVPSQYQVHFSVLQLFKYINKSNPTKKNLKNSYSGSAVHVYSKPHRFVGSGSGFRPPGFAGEVVRIGRDASFPIFHIAEDLDGVLCAPLVWINPVLACIKRYKQKTTTYVSGSHLEITENNVLIIGEKRSLTALFLRVALLDVLAGFCRVHLAAVRTAEVLQMSTEGLQCGVDSSVCAQGSLVLIGKSFVFVHLWKWRRISSHFVLDEFHGIRHATTIHVIVVRGNEEVFHSCGGGSWRAWRARWSRFTLRTLTKKRWKLNIFLNLIFAVIDG